MIPAEASPARSAPSPWVARFAGRFDPARPVVDVACGGGRHTGHLLDLGFDVVAIDRDSSGIDALRGHPRLTVIECDLERGDPPAVAPGSFGGVVVTNYLHRPLFPWLVSLPAPAGWLVYETFAAGTGRGPRNPDFLLRPGELIAWCQPTLQVVEFGEESDGDPPRIVQHIAATRLG